MIFHNAPQGSDAWLAARAGVLTASVFADAVALLTKASGNKKAGEPTAGADEACAIVAVERVSGVPYRSQIDTRATREGHEQEPELRFAYEAKTGHFVTECGLITTDDGRFGYSSDGLVGTDGLIEGKTLTTAKRLIEFLANPHTFIEEYRMQCLGGLWITGRAWIDLVVWIPQIESVGKHLHIFRIERDDDEINALEEKLMGAMRRINSYEDFLRGGSPAAPSVAPITPQASAPARAALPESIF